MNSSVRQLFHELADVPPEERERIFAERRIAADLRAEVESLLNYDSAGESLTRYVYDGAEAALGMATEPPSGYCGPYRLIRLLGSGGMGAVYYAERRDGEIEQRVAIKFLRLAPHQLVFRDRFLRERQILASLSHPGIVGLLDAGHTTDGRPYLVIDYIDGTPIDIYAERLDVRARLVLLIKVCEAISYAHRSLIVHRDLKPSNILVDPAGEPKVLDFGIAKLLEEESNEAMPTLTRDGGGALTPGYAAPEQLTGGSVTTATDIYGLGVLLYVLLTGQHPAGPGTRSYAELLRATLETESPRPSEVAVSSHGSISSEKLRRQLRGDLDTIVAKALKKDPRERYASAADLAEDLRRHLRHQPIRARADTLTYRAVKFVRRNRTVVALAVLALFASAAGVVGTMVQATTARQQRDFALRQFSRAEAINDLNSFLLSDAAPSGMPFTVNDLLARAEHIVERQRGENDASRVELLISIGRQYWTQDEDAKALRVLQEAYRLSRSLADPSIRARASCGLSSVLARGPELPRAEALIQEGLQALPDQAMFALDRVFCLQRGSEVSRLAGASQEAIRRSQTALQILGQSPFWSDLLETRSLMDLAESYRTAGRHREACQTFEHAFARLAALGRDDTQTAGTLFNNWGVSLNQLGRPLEAESILRRAIDISRASQTPDTVSPMLLNNYARTLRDLGRLGEAAEYAEHAFAKAEKSNDQVVINQSMLVRASIYRRQGDILRATQMLAEVEPRLRRNLPPSHIAFTSLLTEKALIAQMRGELDKALALENQAMTIAETSLKAGRQGADYLPWVLVCRSELQLLLNHADDAALDASRALSMLEKSVPAGTLTSTIGGAYLKLGQALQVQGAAGEAHAAFHTAVEHLRQAAGPNHPDTLRASQLYASAGSPR